MKAHIFRELVNDLRDIATQWHGSQQLRERISRRLHQDVSIDEDPANNNPWKLAVIDQLVIAHILTAEHESNPLKAVQDLLAYHADIAVDPRVSGAAAKLVEQAKAEEREACAKVCESERDALNENLQVWQENPTLTPCDEFVADWDSEAKIGEQYAAAIRARGQK